MRSVQLGYCRRRVAALLLVIATLGVGCASGSDAALSVPPVPPATGAAATDTQAEPTATAAAQPTATAAATPTTEPAPTATPVPTPMPTPAPSDLVAAALERSSLRSVDCPADVEHALIECYRAELPLRFASPNDGDVVDLLVAVIDDPDSEDPVVFLPGGPGVAQVNSARRFVNVGHDLVMFDPRGTGESTPKLDCPEADDLWASQRTDDDLHRTDDDDTFEAYEACAARLDREGVDLDAFHTSAVGGDVELLRQLLGYDEWTLWGISYGTRIGLTVMRDHPDGVRAAVLDSVVPFEADFFATIPQYAQRAFMALDSACDGDNCAEAHGDFETNLEALAQRLQEEPVVVDVQRPVSGERLRYRVEGSDLLSMAFAQMYSTRLLVSLPRQIARPDFGGIDEIVNGYVARRDPDRFDLAAALYYSTWCREEFPFHDPTADDALLNAAESEYGESFAEAFGTEDIDRLCAIFDVTPADQVEDEPLQSEIPTLVFAGAFDPITPPEWSRSVAESVGAVYVEMTNHGHGMATSCPAGIRVAFVQDPGGELDLDCVAEAGGPEFD